MDTVMQLRIWGSEEQLREVVARINELDRVLSVTGEQSDIYRLNRDGSAELSQDAAVLLNYAMDYAEKTGGAFDPTVYPLVRAWGFTTQEYRIPSDSEIDSFLKSVGTSKLHCQGSSAILEDGVQLDLGGIAKGYTGQVCAELLDCPAIFSLGGNVQTVGTKPDGSDWIVGIANPFQPERPIATVRFQGTHALVTSGGYQRYFEQDGVTYCHILDPETGRPVENELASVTVFAQDGTRADALSTALFVMGLDRATEFWRGSSDFEVVFILNDGEVLATEGFPISDCDFSRIYRG